MEMRKDYVLDRWVIYSEGRGLRPIQFTSTVDQKSTFPCFFCPGLESTTPEEKGRITDPNDNSKWIFRWFDNKFPALSRAEKPSPDFSSPLFAKDKAFGIHEVLVETPDHFKQLWDLSEDMFIILLKAYKDRILNLEKEDNINYVQVMKNHGDKGGTSLVHSHSQIFAIANIPSIVKEKAEKSQKDSKCLYCQVVHDESYSDRKILETENFISFCPWSSRFNYESWIYPKKHIIRLDQLDDNMFAELAKHMKNILDKLRQLNCSYNMALFYSPKEIDLHLHFEIMPRIATWAGFELSTEMIINSIKPESAASFYRGEIKVEQSH